MEDRAVDEFAIQKQILEIQWTNIRFYWDKANQTVVQTTALPFVVLFGNLLKSQTTLSEHTHYVLRVVLSLAVFLFGLLVFLTLHNYYQRSLRARSIVVEIEKLWKLYDKNGLFHIQPARDSYRYAAFAHDKHAGRMSSQELQICYGVAVAIISEIAVWLLF